MEGRMCMHCGRYIGARDICPYCGEKVKKPLTVQFLKWTSLFVSLFGIFFFLMALKYREPPLIKVQELEPTMNFAQIQLNGMVTRTPYYDQERGTLTFWMDDGTGDIMARAYRNVAHKIIEKDLLPNIGDTVLFEGTLYASEDFFFVSISRSDRFEVKVPEVTGELALDSISEEHLFKRVNIKGFVTRIYTFKGGSQVLNIENPQGGKIAVFIPVTLKELRDQPLEVKKGDYVELAGTVTMYKNELEVIPRRVNDIRVIEVAKKEEKEEKKAEPSYITYQGEITTIKSFKQGVIFNVKDKEGKVLKCLIWKDRLVDMGISSSLITGSKVWFKGKHKIYKGEDELIVYEAEVKSIPDPVSISKIISADTGKAYTIQGKITEIREFKSGVRYKVKDETGTIVVWFWQDVYDQLLKKPEQGNRVKISGEVTKYRDILEIQPRVRTDVILVPDTKKEE